MSGTTTTQGCFYCHSNRHLLIIYMLVVLVSSLSQLTSMAEGRAVPKYSETSSSQKGWNNEEEVIRAQMIGSRPPRCERRCYSCGHCEAIQVPIGPRIFPNHNHRRSHFYESHTIAYSRGDDITNYKPMSWKCKCGDFIFNP